MEDKTQTAAQLSAVLLEEVPVSIQVWKTLFKFITDTEIEGLQSTAAATIIWRPDQMCLTQPYANRWACIFCIIIAHRDTHMCMLQ